MNAEVIEGGPPPLPASDPDEPVTAAREGDLTEGDEGGAGNRWSGPKQRAVPNEHADRPGQRANQRPNERPNQR